MKIVDATASRDLNTVELKGDLCVVGGGLSGVCAAIVAAREGLKVVLVQDRPVLGGNSSSEVRLWVLGATSHLGNNNRWAREGGVINEILIENMFRNPEGNPVLVDPLLLDKVTAEPNITLLLNTSVFEVIKDSHEPSRIASIRGFCSQNATMYRVHSPLFCDASGDGTVAFMAGGAFRIGCEGRAEFDEGFAPPEPTYELLGHSLYFYSKDTGQPVEYVPPAFALRDLSVIPRWRAFNSSEHGARLWWIEFGGRLDTVHETETIKWELWKVVYGVWNHIKNSGQFPEAANLTLEWVGMIPGKRESRRFEGDYILSQKDIVDQRQHFDAVGVGGWAIDLHPADGVYSEQDGCTQWHSKGVYQIPYRCLYSRNVDNLFLAGRIISATHVAFGSTRVMGTGAHNAQAVGMAAAMCKAKGLLPRDITERSLMRQLQERLVAAGQFIPDFHASPHTLADDWRHSVTVKASSQLSLAALPPTDFISLDCARAMLIPVPAGLVPTIRFRTRVSEESTATELVVKLRGSRRPGNFTPDETLDSQMVRLAQPAKVEHELVANGVANRQRGGSGLQQPAYAVADSREELHQVSFSARLDQPRYLMICFQPAPGVEIAISDTRITGILALKHSLNRAVAKSLVQLPPPGIGVDTFEFWLPERRPDGKNLALEFDPPLCDFSPNEVLNDLQRPTTCTNAWIADLSDPHPFLQLRWPESRTLSQITLYFDCDWDHPMESVLLGHPERIMPFCIRNCRITDSAGRLLGEIQNNHQASRTIAFEPTVLDQVFIHVEHPLENVPAAIFRVEIR